jgi:hypothetical protein
MKTWIVKTRAVVRREYIIAAETAEQAEDEAMFGDAQWESEVAEDEEALSVDEAREGADAERSEQAPA